MAQHIPKTLRARIKTACDVIRGNGPLDRRFDSLFEMGDGESVMRGVVDSSDGDAELRIRMYQRGLRWVAADIWGKPSYF